MSHKNSKRQMLRQRQARQTSMPLWLSLAGGVVLVGVLLYAFFGNAPLPKAAIEVNGAPRLKVDKERVDFGDRKLGTEVDISLQVTNIGDQPLRFAEKPYIEVVEGCWPPTPVIGSMTLQPGESTIIFVKFGMHGISMAGNHNFSVHLVTNDPTQKDRTVSILSNWVP